MTDIDCRDCHLIVKIGRRTRLSIYNHMRQFVIGEITAKGFQTEDAQLFNMLTIEERACRLAEEIAERVEEHYEDVTDLIGPPSGENIEEIINETVSEVEAEFLEDPLDGVDMLIELASGTPMDILGTGKSYDVGLGPDGGA